MNDPQHGPAEPRDAPAMLDPADPTAHAPAPGMLPSIPGAYAVTPAEVAAEVGTAEAYRAKAYAGSTLRVCRSDWRGRDFVLQDGETARVVSLVQRFAALLPDRASPAQATRAAFDHWLDDALTCGVRVVETFARGLAQDGAAVLRRSPHRGVTGRPRAT